ncbi:hypothetical protein CPB84DRAFT_1845222 [Gymnopilus junonius]|uniref:BAR domain-containing protein n=1 Tax=Gymnopilus junonius TaxID=109634 RepID=A0A9P5NS67_GYMJU|nr:hypothetical protein CPB84DRAFT_1845222 [Gymnopilus junonius]
MASSKLGRLRQWAEEKISSKEKHVVNEEFKELEKDIELRKEGIQRLILASIKYHNSLSKKKSSPALEDAEKMLPIDILGMVMILHGEEFGEDSPFGSALVKLGRAHCKIAALQEAFAVTFKDTFVVSMERFGDEIKEYESLKKKLETRRAALEAAAAKFEKLQHSKKEKDKREAEDELERVRQRYEETAEDIRAHMHAIQENEHVQFRELVTFLDLEMNFVQSHLDVLRDVKHEVVLHERSDSRRSNYSSISSSKDAYFQSLRPSNAIPTTPVPRAKPIAGLPAGENPKRLEITANASTVTSADSSEDDGDGKVLATPSRRKSKRSRSGSTASNKDKEKDKAPSGSRPGSRLSLTRKRANSSANPTNTNAEAAAADDKSDKEGKRSRRMSLGGWASNAVESVTGGGANASTGSLGKTTRRKSKDKEAFTALDDDDDFEPRGSRSSMDRSDSEGGTLKKKRSFRSLTRRKSVSKSKDPTLSSSPSLTHSSSSLSVPSSFRRKVVRALHAFTSSSPDELNFKAGDEIVVIQEPKRRGLFPKSYTEVVGSLPGTIAGKPKIQRRESSGQGSSKGVTGGFIASLFGGGSEVEQDRDHRHQNTQFAHDHDHDHDEPLRIAGVKPMSIRSPVYFGRFDQIRTGHNEADRASFTDQDSMTESEDDAFGFKKQMTMQELERNVNNTVEQAKSKWTMEVLAGGSEEDIGWSVVPPATTGSVQPFPPPPAMPRRNTLKASDQLQPPMGLGLNRSLSDNPLSLSTMSSSNGFTTSTSSPLLFDDEYLKLNTKKIPPPPPPRRTMSQTPGSNPPPAIPERSVRPFGAPAGHKNSLSQSTTASTVSNTSLDVTPTPRSRSSQGQGTEGGGVGGIGYDRSPFESVTDLGLETQSTGEGPKRAEGEKASHNPFRV